MIMTVTFICTWNIKKLKITEINYLCDIENEGKNKIRTLSNNKIELFEMTGDTHDEHI